MRARGLGVAAAVLIISFPVFIVALTPAEESAVESTSAKESEPTKAKLLIVHFSVGPSWSAEKPPHEQTSFRDHGRNLKRLRDEGRIVLGARYSDKGMIVLRAESEERARAEMSADPGVRAGIFTFELFELRPFYDGCLSAEPAPRAPSGGG